MMMRIVLINFDGVLYANKYQKSENGPSLGLHDIHSLMKIYESIN